MTSALATVFCLRYGLHKNVACLCCVAMLGRNGRNVHMNECRVSELVCGCAVQKHSEDDSDDADDGDDTRTRTGNTMPAIHLYTSLRIHIRLRMALYICAYIPPSDLWICFAYVRDVL